MIRCLVIDNDTDLNPNTPTYPKILKKAGYQTGFIGKWHMGHGTDERRQNFDYWVSFKGQGRYINPELAPTIRKLDNRLKELIEQNGGSAKPIWYYK